MHLRRLLILIFGFTALALVAVLLLRTLAFDVGPTVALKALPEAPPIDAERAAQSLARAIAFRTVNIGAEHARDEAAWLALHDWLAERYPLAHGALQRETVAGLSLLYTWPGSDPALPPLVLMAHQDVVPINMATIRDWTHPPFAGTVADGRVWGRGALDDKGSLVALMEAVETLLAADFAPRRSVLLLFGHDEETGGDGARAAVALLRARGIVPYLVLDEGFMGFAEFPLTGRRAALIGIGEKGYLTLRLTARAPGGHSSMPPRDSAAVRLARALVALDEHQLPGSVREPPVSDLLRALAPEMPFLQRLTVANAWLFEGLLERAFAADPAGNAVLRTTTAPTMLEGAVKDNVLPQAATALVNFRLHPRDSAASVQAHVEDLVAPFGIDVSRAEGVLGSDPSPLAPTDTAGYRALHALAHWTVDGAPVAPGLVVGATDARHFADLTPAAYRFMPMVATRAEIAGLHGTDEHLEIANLARMVEGYARFVQAVAGGE
jgi:carboxypeptidase PM20D1